MRDNKKGVQIMKRYGRKRTKRGKGLSSACKGLYQQVHQEMIQKLKDEFNQLREAGQDTSFVEFRLANLGA
jgi:hypothetical protein